MAEKPLSAKQCEALINAEETLYGDVKIIEGYGRSVAALKRRGLVEGDTPYVYLTDPGKDALSKLLA